MGNAAQGSLNFEGHFELAAPSPGLAGPRHMAAAAAERLQLLELLLGCRGDADTQAIVAARDRLLRHCARGVRPRFTLRVLLRTLRRGGAPMPIPRLQAPGDSDSSDAEDSGAEDGDDLEEGEGGKDQGEPEPEPGPAPTSEPETEGHKMGQAESEGMCDGSSEGGEGGRAAGFPLAEIAGAFQWTIGGLVALPVTVTDVAATAANSAASALTAGATDVAAVANSAASALTAGATDVLTMVSSIASGSSDSEAVAAECKSLW